MPFIKLNNSWSNLAQQYNKAFNNKPEIPAIRYTSFDDGLIRGGAINVGISSVRDTARIGKFFASTKGVLFITKQVGLQLSNPLLEQLPSTPAPTSNQNILNTIGNAINNFANKNGQTRIYNLGINTLAQVPINAIGGHIIRHGLLPIGGVGFLNGDSLSTLTGTDNTKLYNYEYAVRENNKNGKNRLVGYLDKLYNNNGNSSFELQSYNGGAASVYGIGKTFIKTTSLSTDRLPSVNSDIYKSVSSTIFLQYNGINRYFIDYRNEANKGNAQTVDLGENYNRPVIGPNDPQPANPSTNNAAGDLDFKVFRNQRTFPTQNIQTRIGTSTSEYGPNNRKTDYKVDSINVINITDSKTFYTKNSNNSPNIPSWVLNKGDKQIDGDFGRDIIKFRFEFLNNDVPVFATKDDSGNTVDRGINTDVLAFRAYLDDFQDGMQAKWNPYRYMGRGEEFYVYDGFTRDISVAFTLYAHSPEEMAPLYKKLNYLMSTFTPDYANNKMRGNIGYLTVGDYLYRQPGVFTDIKLSGMLDTHWEIALDDKHPIDKDQYEVPKHIKVNVSFKPIHTFLPRKAKYNQGKAEYNTPFITLDKKAYPAQAGERFNKNKERTAEAINKYLD